MTNWKRGGWTGSLNGWVRREIKEHFGANASAKRSHYSRITRVSHFVFDHGKFGRFIAIYLSVAILMGVVEALCAPYMPPGFFAWTGTDSLKSLLTNITSYLISAQVGVLGVISIAIGLVTIIAQRENASTDVQVYYHESFAFGLVASSIALIVVLCVQLFWPVQFLLHSFGIGTGLQLFKLILTAVHTALLILNLSATAHFVATTLAFVQQGAREGLRERYTANVVLPVEMRKRLREQLYLGAGPDLVKEFWPVPRKGWNQPVIYLGTNFSGIGEVEIPLTTGERVVLQDVRMAWVRWAVGRWLIRCHASNRDPNNRVAGLRDEPFLIFPPRLDDKPAFQAGLCRRRGGVPLTSYEKLVLRWAFKFRKVRENA